MTPVILDRYVPLVWDDDLQARIYAPHAQKMYWYQRDAVMYAIARDCRVLLAMEPGLGKTLVTMALLMYYANSPDPATQSWPVLVLCPSVMKAGWMNAVQADLPADVAAATILIENGSVHPDPILHRIVVMTYAMAKTRQMTTALRAMHFRTCVCDESHALGSPPRSTRAAGSMQTQILTPLLQACRYRIFLTGTPCGGRSIRLQPQLNILRPDIPIFTDYWLFGKRYGAPTLRPTGPVRDDLEFLGASCCAELNRLLQTHVMFRHTKESLRIACPSTKRPWSPGDPLSGTGDGSGSHGGTTASIVKRAKIQKDIVRVRQVHWIHATKSQDRERLQRMSEEVRILQDGLDRQHAEWAHARTSVGTRVCGAVQVAVDSIDYGTVALQTKRNEVVRRTSLVKLKIASQYLDGLMSEVIDAGRKLVVMVYHVAVLNMVESRVRGLLAVTDDFPNLRPKTSKVNRSRASSPAALAAWRARHNIAGPGETVIAGQSFSARKMLTDQQRRSILPYIRLDGSVSAKNVVDDSIQRFQTDPVCRIAILSMPKAATGITLTAASDMLILELPYQADLLKQAEARIDRSGQAKDTVHIKYVLLKDSTDEDTWRLVQRKMDNAARVIDASPGGAVFAYRRERVDITSSSI